MLGVNRTSGLVAEPILIALYSIPKVTLLSAGAAVLRPRRVGQVTFGSCMG